MVKHSQLPTTFVRNEVKLPEPIPILPPKHEASDIVKKNVTLWAHMIDLWITAVTLHQEAKRDLDHSSTTEHMQHEI